MLCGLFTSRDPVTSLLYDVIDDVVDFLQSRPILLRCTVLPVFCCRIELRPIVLQK